MRGARLEQQLCSALRSNLAGSPLRVPEAGRLAWGWFITLHGARASNGYGPNPISHGEIDAFARLYRWPLEPRHADLILALDRVWLEYVRQRAPHTKGGTKVSPKSSGQAVNVGAFDAVFG